MGADDESEAFITAQRPSGAAARAYGRDNAAAAAQMGSPLTWSEPLKRYVNRAFASCSSDAERNKMEETLKALITARTTTGTVVSALSQDILAPHVDAQGVAMPSMVDASFF